MKVILDTSFILTCIKEKVDFLDAEEFGELLLPIQVIEELKRIAINKNAEEKQRASLALEIIEKNNEKFNFVTLEKKSVDTGIMQYTKKFDKKDLIVATIDKELKKALNSTKILVIRAKKKLQVI